jgi:hypothetical protein
MAHKISTRSIVIAALMVWMFAIGAGMWMIWSYQNTPGAVGIPPAQ